MSQPTLSIVTSTFQDAQALARTLESIAGQAGRGDTEVIVVDGGSTDGTDDVVAGHGDLVTRYVSEADDGVYDGMNKGLALAAGRYVQFVNSGDVYHSADSLRTILERAGSSSALWLTGRARNLGGGTIDPVAIPNLPHRWGRHAAGLQPHCHQACIFDTELLRRIGGHDLSIGLVADFDVILRFGLVMAPEVIDTVLVDYDGRGMSWQRRAEIPALLHATRVRRMQLGRTGAALDQAMTEVNAAALRARITLGAARRRLRG